MNKKYIKSFLLAGVIFSSFAPSSVIAAQPSIQFYSTVNGQNLAMPDKQIVTKDSKLKLYFRASSHMTIEYKGYIYDQATGTYDDLKIGGAFTGGVQASFVGMKLSGTQVNIKGAVREFQKGDVIIFKFRVVSSDGLEQERVMKALIGDATSNLNVLDSINIP